MKILIFSDTHGIKHSILEKIFNFEHADFMIHAGDFCDQGDTTTHRFNTKKYKDNFKYWVDGNHDLFQKNLAKYTDKPMSFYDDIFSSYKVFNIADKRFLLTHFFMDDNRIYNTISQLTNEKIDPEIEKKWRDKLIAEIRPNYVITGHNHIATIEKNSSYTLLNPGSICKPKDHEKGSYMIGEYNHNKNDWEFKIKRIII